MNEFNENSIDRICSEGDEYVFEINGVGGTNEEKLKNREEEEISRVVNNYLPIGSVVSLDQYRHYKMIIGYNYCNDGKEYDYIACEYPIGISNKSNILFNKEQIYLIVHIGFITESMLSYGDSLAESKNKKNR